MSRGVAVMQKQPAHLCSELSSTVFNGHTFSSLRSRLSVMRAHLGVLRRVTAPNFMKPHTATDIQPLQHSDNNYCCFFGAVRKRPPIPDCLKGKEIKAANSPL